MLFERVLNSKIYIDKSLMISCLNDLLSTVDNMVCVSRPRRFGKSIAGYMIAAYYSKGCDSSSLFDGLKIASVPSYRRYLNQFNVIKIDMNGEYSMKGNDCLNAMNARLKIDFCNEYPNLDFSSDCSLSDYIYRVYSYTGETFVIIIDEYDVLVRESSSILSDYLKFLNSLFKNEILLPAISLGYLTGILPI